MRAHCFPADARDLVEALLVLDPASRLGSDTIGPAAGAAAEGAQAGLPAAGEQATIDAGAKLLAPLRTHQYFVGVNWATLRSDAGPTLLSKPAEPQNFDSFEDKSFDGLSSAVDL